MIRTVMTSAGAAVEGRGSLFPHDATAREVPWPITYVFVTTKSQSLSLVSLLSSRDIYMPNSQLDFSTWVSHRLLGRNGHVHAFLHRKPVSPPFLKLLPVSGKRAACYHPPKQSLHRLPKHCSLSSVTKSILKCKLCL